MSIFRAIALIFFLVMGCSAYSYHPSDSITFYLLRGIGRESGHWGTKVPEAIRQRIPTARFVMMDLPGAGKYHNQTALPTVEKMADFLRDHYLPHQDSTSHRRVILATSLAGNVALEWMTTYPKDFHGAVLISSSFKGVCKSKERVDSKVRRDFIDIFLTQDIA
ncbi:MAG: alpha/beta hydrolase, partial [Bacteroidota bacterium]